LTLLLGLVKSSLKKPGEDSDIESESDYDDNIA